MDIKKICADCNKIITNKIKIIIGIVCIILAVITDIAVGYDDKYNGIVTIIFSLGMISFVNAFFAAVYRSAFSYILYIPGNFAGILLYFFVVSRHELMGDLFMVLFLVLVFILMWIFEICLLSGLKPVKRILGGLIVNAVTLLMIALSAGLVVTVSVIKSMA